MFQKDRHATARFLEMTAPVELRTPEVSPLPVGKERIEEYRLEQLAKLPYVLSCDEAQARLEKRQSTLVLPSIAPETEPKSYKRRVPSRGTIKIEYLRRANAANGKNPFVAAALAMYHHAHGNYEKAKQFKTEAQKLDPSEKYASGVQMDNLEIAFHVQYEAVDP